MRTAPASRPAEPPVVSYTAFGQRSGYWSRRVRPRRAPQSRNEPPAQTQPSHQDALPRRLTRKSQEWRTPITARCVSTLVGQTTSTGTVNAADLDCPIPAVPRTSTEERATGKDRRLHAPAAHHTTVIFSALPFSIASSLARLS